MLGATDLPFWFHAAEVAALVVIIAQNWRQASTLRALENIAMADVNDVKAAIQKLQDDVTAAKAVEDSAVALLNGLTQLLKDATSSAGSFDELKSSVDAIAAQVESDTAALSDAVTANTPAAPSA